MESDIVVVGGGVLGVTTAFWLSELYDCSVLVLEKERDLALHTTLRNTGLAHRPYYLDPVKKRVFARAAERSYGLWKRLATRFGLPWRELGTLMVATEESQIGELKEYERWGVQNGMDEGEYELLDARSAAKAEPNVVCHGAILSRRDAATDYSALTRAVWAMASENGVKLLPCATVKKVNAADKGITMRLGDKGSLNCSLLINVAGGGSLDIAHSMGLAEEYTDLHFRGEYWVVDPARAPQVSRSIYSVARHKEFPFLDPHFVVRVDEKREVGPNAVPVSGPEVYEGMGGTSQFVSKLLERPLGPKARLLMKGEFLSLAWGEWRSSMSKRAMCERVRKFVPSLAPEMLSERGMAGVRSSLVDRDGFVPEAVLAEDSNSLHVLNFNSPGATGAPVFSAQIVRRLESSGMMRSFKRRVKKDALWDFEATETE